ncbi:fibrinogen C domain-containing protein 1-A-like [Oratosquilla oratoria]|uniref:fibrinogen C domain-containing protein 1-A-like n=1 Tax=Oratosquilla oratoria TaxID=337810 RepID=UPI003F76C70B
MMGTDSRKKFLVTFLLITLLFPSILRNLPISFSLSTSSNLPSAFDRFSSFSTFSFFTFIPILVFSPPNTFLALPSGLQGSSSTPTVSTLNIFKSSVPVTVILSSLFLRPVYSLSVPSQMTDYENVVEDYNFKVLKDLVFNTSQGLKTDISKLHDMNEQNKKSMKELEDQVRLLKESVAYGMADLKQEGFSMRDVVKNTSASVGILKSLLEAASAPSDKGAPVIQQKDPIDISEKVNSMAHMVMAQDCQDLYELGYNASGVYRLLKFGKQVLCDMETDGGGWIVVQKRTRVTPQVDFSVGWHAYKKGFGDLESEFWIGNDFLHILTNQRRYTAAVDMVDYELGAHYALYNSFRVGSESEGYTLDIGNYTGNATDAFKYHHGRPFTTKDRDNDLYDDGNCAEYFSGAWWFDRCYDALLNGIYPTVPDRINSSFITWWAHQDDKKVALVLTEVTIRLRPWTQSQALDDDEE